MKKRRIKHFKSNKSLMAVGVALLATGLAVGNVNSVKADTTDDSSKQAVAQATTAENTTVEAEKKSADTAVSEKQTATTAATTTTTTTTTAVNEDKTATAAATAPATKTASKAVQATKVTAQKAVTATAQPTKNAFKTTSGVTNYYAANGQVVKHQFIKVNDKQYYADATGKIAKSTSKTLNGIKVSFDKDGAVENGIDHAQLLRDQTEFLTAVKLKNGVKYDWTESKNGYQESAVHEMAQLLAQGDVKEDKQVIASLMEKNNSMQGKVLATLKTDVSANNETAAQFVSDLIRQLGTTSAAGSVVGAGYYNGTLAGLIYKVEAVTQPAQVSSTLTPSVTKVYGQDKVSVMNGLKDGQAFTADESKKLLTTISTSLKTGPAGTEISQDD